MFQFPTSNSEEQQPAQEAQALKAIDTVHISSSITIKKDSGIRCDTLFFLTGVKYEFTGDIDTLDIIGLPSMSWFFENKYREAPRREILEVIDALKPQRLVLIGAADTFISQYDPNTDLKKKPQQTYENVRDFRRALQLIDNPDDRKYQIFFTYINTEYFLTTDGKIKTLFDLYRNYNKDIVSKELTSGEPETAFFRKINITEIQIDRLSELFGIDTPENFYKAYGENSKVDNNEFVFGRYICQRRGGQVSKLRHLDSEKFIKVKGKYILITKKQLNSGIRSIGYDAYDVGSLKEDYGKEFVFDIRKYDGFINEPCFDSKYKRDIYQVDGKHTYRYYNVSEPIEFEPVQGEFPNCAKLFKHIFGGHGTIEKPIIGDRFTVFMDWLKIAVQHPTQKLPMILMVSKENGTGKSTLMDFLMYMFGANAIKTNMEDFLGRFNPHNAYKKFMFLEEVKLEGDKDVAKDTLKELVTGPLAFVEGKGLPKEQISNHKVIIAASNHEDNVLKLSKDDERFFIVKPNVIPRTAKDPLLIEKMKAEIPALLHYLINDTITHPYQFRTWFLTDYILTPEFWNVVYHSKSLCERSVEDMMRDIFLTYRINEVRMYIEYIEEFFKGKGGYKYTTEQIKKVFKEKGYDKLSDSASFVKIPIDIGKDEMDKKCLLYYKQKGTDSLPKKRYYLCRAEDWLTVDELKQIEGGFESIELVDYEPIKVHLNGSTQEYVFSFLNGQTDFTKRYTVDELLASFNKLNNSEVEKSVFIDCLKSHYDLDVASGDKKVFMVFGGEGEIKTVKFSQDAF